MKRILPELQPDDGESVRDLTAAEKKKLSKRSQSVHTAKVEEFFCERWSCSLSTLRHCTANKYPPARSFSDGNAAFFDDLKQYGSAQFLKATGAVVKSSLGKGPDRAAYAREVYEYKRLRAEQKKKDDLAARRRVA